MQTSKLKIREKTTKISLMSGRGDGQLVSELVFYYDDLCSNPAEDHNFVV